MNDEAMRLSGLNSTYVHDLYNLLHGVNDENHPRLLNR